MMQPHCADLPLEDDGMPSLWSRNLLLPFDAGRASTISKTQRSWDRDELLSFLACVIMVGWVGNMTYFHFQGLP